MIINEKKDGDDKDDDNEYDENAKNLEAVERAIVLDKKVLLLAYREVVTKLEKDDHDDNYASDDDQDDGYEDNDD